MKFSIADAARSRRSVRTFDDKRLKDSDLEALKEFTKKDLNPFGLPVEFRFLDKDEDKLSSPVLKGEHTYMSAKTKKTEDYEIGYGYSFEYACLYAESLGIGTVIIAGTFDRPAFEKAMELSDDEIFITASPVGYSAEKLSIRESMMRKGLRADDRVPFEEIFYKDNFENKLSKEDAGVFAEALEMVRLAPSAVNKQPWRVVVDGDKVHFYEKRTINEGEFDVQKVDMGIAACHFDLSMQENGHEGKFVKEAPDIKVPEGLTYTISYERAK